MLASLGLYMLLAGWWLEPHLVSCNNTFPLQSQYAFWVMTALAIKAKYGFLNSGSCLCNKESICLNTVCMPHESDDFDQPFLFFIVARKLISISQVLRSTSWSVMWLSTNATSPRKKVSHWFKPTRSRPRLYYWRARIFNQRLSVFLIKISRIAA